METTNQTFDIAKVEEKLKGVKSLLDFTGSNGIIQEMIKGTVERILKAEQEAHLGYEPYRKSKKTTDNARNGYSSKRVRTSSGEVEIEVPRDRKGTFDPQFIQKHQSFDPDLEKRVASFNARSPEIVRFFVHLYRAPLLFLVATPVNILLSMVDFF